MNPTRQMHELGQSLWLDYITRIFSTTEPWRYDDAFDAMFTRDEPVVFAFHGYAGLTYPSVYL